MAFSADSEVIRSLEQSDIDLNQSLSDVSEQKKNNNNITDVLAKVSFYTLWCRFWAP